LIVETDILGAPYERRTIDLGQDDEGPVVATLVRRRAGTPTRRAVLYLHGYTDYFFQTHLADFYVEQGLDFYAIDLRKYGRSLLAHQTPNFCRSLTDYFPELDEAARIIRTEDGHDTLLVNGHSTGGLIAPLWTYSRRDVGLVDGLFLNSPFFDFNTAWFMRRPAAATVANLGRAWPYRIVPLSLNPVYGHSLHADHKGEWRYNETWKPLGGFGVRAGWLAAIRHGQRRLRAGLDIRVPVLVGSSSASYRSPRWGEQALSSDAVLDVDHMARWAPRLGRHVTLVRIDGGLHDLALSAEPVRKQVFNEVARWMGAYLDGGYAEAAAHAAEAESADADAVGLDAPGDRQPATAPPTRPAGEPIGTG
jgi:alpha-beta hydrolase superfamily lysophospholipase